MARGWESKSVEEQMATAVEQSAAASGNGVVDKRMAAQHRASRERQMQALKLQRENILSQRTSNPARRSALESALAQIEAQLNALG